MRTTSPLSMPSKGSLPLERRAHMYHWNKRFQSGCLFIRGKRRQMWVARWLEPTITNGVKGKPVLRSRVIGPCDQLSKAAARTILTGWLQPLNEGIYEPTEAISWGAFYERWQRDILPTYREATRKFYHDTAKAWVAPRFKPDGLLKDIRPADLQQFLNSFSPHYSRSVLKHIRATLNCLFKTAVIWQYLEKNPAAGLRLPPGKPVVRAVVLPPAAISRLISHLFTPYREMVIIASTTGLRPTELWGLQWGDFDFDQAVLHVQRRVYRRHVGEPKTPQSDRVIPLASVVIDALQPLCGDPTAFVFHGESADTPLRPDGLLSKYILPVARALGLPDFTWRSFRRSAESAMHNAGIPMKAQQAMLGHTNPSTTLLYAETNEESKRAAAEELGSQMFPELSHVASAIVN